ncbi:MAG: hypothetical protein ACTHKC_08335 [Candidatus Nitrosocosmicus sp.]
MIAFHLKMLLYGKFVHDELAFSIDTESYENDSGKINQFFTALTHIISFFYCNENSPRNM